ncbi:MAG: NADPH-dependent reductase [Candidatus Saccharibacteria bacterium]|nr:NADPH-dependent reductase [Candidatus Saccharibacteria bacterium]
MTKIAVIVGSTRQGRQTDKLAKWAAQEVGMKADVEVLDLRDYPIPFIDEPISPRYNPDRKPEPETKKWLDKIATFDGFVFVTPEYNRSTSAVLKNAIDVMGHEIDDKPVALVGHGSSGGAQAIANLRMALPGVGAITIPQALFFSDRLADSISDEGELKQELRDKPYGPQEQLSTQVDSLLWYTTALNTARV